MLRTKLGKPGSLSFMEVTADSKAGFDVVEVGQKFKMSVSEPPCSLVFLGTASAGKVSCSDTELTQIYKEGCEQVQAAGDASRILFKDLCTESFNHLCGLSVTCADWLFNKNLSQV